MLLEMTTSRPVEQRWDEGVIKVALRGGIRVNEGGIVRWDQGGTKVGLGWHCEVG